jgi:hypothetical protein
MSSHHFVKEQQEPALIILQADDYAFDLVADILEWSPTVVVGQDALDKVMSWGIKIDRIVADESFIIKNTDLLEEQFPLEFLPCKKSTLLDTGIQYLLNSGHSAAVILGFDHTKAIALEPLLKNLDLVIYDGPIRYFPAKAGELKKWLPSGSIQIHAPENNFVEISTASASRLIRINHATFIDVEEGMITFKGKCIFWIGEFVTG